jgi:tetratricopeptide (TPR) repeat protein
MPKPILRWFYNHVAAWCVLFRQRERAIDFYRRMLALDPHDAVALASLGFNYAQLGRKREALGIFDRVVALTPNDAEMHFNRGFLLQEFNDHDGAIAAFRAALERNPDHDRALYGLGLSLISTRRPEEAIPPLTRNTQLQPMSPYGWYQLARVQYSLGRGAETQKILDHLATFEPDVARQLARETGLEAKTLS